MASSLQLRRSRVRDRSPPSPSPPPMSSVGGVLRSLTAFPAHPPAGSTSGLGERGAGPAPAGAHPGGGTAALGDAWQHPFPAATGGVLHPISATRRAPVLLPLTTWTRSPRRSSPTLMATGPRRWCLHRHRRVRPCFPDPAPSPGSFIPVGPAGRDYAEIFMPPGAMIELEPEVRVRLHRAGVCQPRCCPSSCLVRSGRRPPLLHPSVLSWCHCHALSIPFRGAPRVGCARLPVPVWGAPHHRRAP